MLVSLALGLLVVAPAPAKTLNRAVLIGSDGAWVRVMDSAAAFENLARDPTVKPQRAKGGYVRLYFAGPGEFPANRARYYPGQRCIALDWPTYERSCIAVSPKLIVPFHKAYRLARFNARPTILSRLRYTSSSGASPALAGLTGSIELAILRKGVVSLEPGDCYQLTGTWKGPAAAERPKRFSLCIKGVYADSRLHPLSRVVWEWFRRNVGPPDTAPEPPTDEHPVACVADEAEELGRRFVAAFNDGDFQALDSLFAQEPAFEWYATGAPGERLLPLAGDRPSLMPYFRERHEFEERMVMNSLRFNGNTRTLRPYGNFEYTLTRSASDLPPTPFAGKGAAFCFRNRSDLILVWAMARRDP